MEARSIEVLRPKARASNLHRYASLVFAGPPLVVLIVLILYPTLYLMRLAFSRFDLSSMDRPELVGLLNFQLLWTDASFWNALVNTLVISVSAVGLEFLLGLGLALLLNQPLRAGAIFRSLFIIPLMIPPVVVGLNFRLIFDVFGPTSSLARILGLGRIDWLGHAAMAKVAITLTDVWQWTPFVFIILLAGLHAIPQDLFDAAAVDGATAWETFRSVIWPMLIPAATVALAFRLIDAFKIFDIVYMVTYGGPAASTEVLSLYVYWTAFRFGNLGYAATLAVIMLMLLSVFSILLIRIMRLERRLGWQ
jgi:multiple sugar transport system permease protein